MKRIALFLMTNLAIIVVLSITLRLLGVERILDEQGAGLDLNSLLIFSAVFGFGGAFISLAMSKWIAKRSTGARVITQPANSITGYAHQKVWLPPGRWINWFTDDIHDGPKTVLVQAGCATPPPQHSRDYRPSATVGWRRNDTAKHSPHDRDLLLL